MTDFDRPIPASETLARALTRQSSPSSTAKDSNEARTTW